jgi:hypothetical protein
MIFSSDELWEDGVNFRLLPVPGMDRKGETTSIAI